MYCLVCRKNYFAGYFTCWVITAYIFGFHHFCSFFFRLYVNWRFMRGIEAQFLALQKGFTELIPQHLLKAFDHKELEVYAMPIMNWKQLKTSMSDAIFIFKLIRLTSLLLLFLYPSLPADHRWTWEDWYHRLEDQHSSEALHKWKQRGAVVLAGSGGFQWGEERTSPAVCHRIHQGPITGI